ncbi:MAG: thiol-activated cytolysin family protein [Bacteroidota bacterium]
MNTLIKNTLMIFVIIFSLTHMGCDREDDMPEPKPTPSPSPNPTDSTSKGNDAEAIANFFTTLPSWDDFAQNPPEQEAAPTGATGQEISQTMDVPVIQEDGSVDTLYNVTYECQETPYSLSQDPERIVMYSPDVEILWPGSLIQGASHKDPIGSLRGLVINERDSINVSIPSLPTGSNFRRVKPNQANVGSAIGEMLGNATANNLSTPSTISFTMESYHSEKQMALAMGLSGKYLGFSGSASGSFNSNQSETTITVQFFQKMFEVVVEPPQTPGAFFNEDFTEAKLQQQIDLGRMGPNNLPVYVSNIVYGRMMMFSLTSTASETEIRAMLQAAYSNIAGNVKASMSAKQKTIIEESTIAITSLGGDADATINMIRSGNWQDYFTNSAPLSSAAPLSYTFRNLGDGSIANIVETDEFSISECTERVGVPGVYDFFPGTSENMSDIAFPVETYTGDFNNDGRDDLMFNHKDNFSNQIKLAYGNSKGTFDFQPVINYSGGTNPNWSIFKTHIGDVNGDQLDDVIFNALESDNNRTYVAINQGNGQFTYSNSMQRPAGGWNKYELHLGDIDSDGADEFLWRYNGSGYGSRLYTGKYMLAADSVKIFPYQDFSGTGVWGSYDSFVGNVDGGDEDLVFADIGGNSDAFTLLGNGDSTMSLGTTYFLGEGQHYYEPYGGQATNDRLSDIIMVKLRDNDMGVLVASSNGNGTFSWTGGTKRPSNYNTTDWRSYKPYIGDVDGDGIDDITLTNQESGVTCSKVITALGTPNGEYDFTPVKQEQPYANTWAQYTILHLDINGDNKNDLVWIKPASTADIFIALAK